jgi:hypothetical protein
MEALTHKGLDSDSVELTPNICVILKRVIIRIEIISIICDLYLSLHVINPSSKVDNENKEHINNLCIMLEFI